MKTTIYFAIITIVLVELVDCQPTLLGKVTLQDQILQNPCDILELAERTYLGSQIFQNDPINETPHMVLSGWFLVRPYDISQIYNLFVIKETALNIKITLQYDLVQKNVLLNQAQPTEYQTFFTSGYPLISKWWFIYTDIQLNVNGELQTRINITIGSSILPELSLSIPLLTPPITTYFKKKSLVISIGSHSGIQSSCAMIKKINFYWLGDPSYLFTPTVEFTDPSSGNTYLYQYFDFFYTNQNRGKLLSLGYNQNPLILSHERGDSQEVQKGETIKTDFINIDQELGLVINFQAKLTNLGVSQLTTIFALKNSAFPLSLIFTDNKIQFNDIELTNVDLSVWNHFTIIIKNTIIPKVLLYIKNSSIQFTRILLTTKYSVEQLQFGDLSNTESFYISNIRIYKGHYLTSVSNCVFGLMQFNSQCLACSAGYLFVYNNQMQCRLNDPSDFQQEINDVYNLNQRRSVCSSNMVNDLNDFSKCICLKGFYMDLDYKCQKCPSYCIECSNPTTCTLQDNTRLPNGQCPPTTFDDGYSCINISAQLKIKSRSNIVEHKYFSDYTNPYVTPQSTSNCGSSVSWEDQWYSIKQNQLNSFSSVQFFISFSFTVLSDISLKAAVFVYDGGPSFGMMIYVQCSSGIYYIVVYDNNTYRHIFKINDKEEVWIGLYFTTSKVTTIINQHGTYQIKQFNASVSPPVQINLGAQPQFVSCVSLSKTKPFQFIYDMPNLSDLNLLNLLYRSDKQIFAQFTVDKSNQLYNLQAENLMTQQLSNIQLLQFPNSLSNFSFLSGFTFTNTYLGKIDSFANDSQCALSFYFVLQVSEIHMQTPLISYNIPNGLLGLNVKIFLFPLFSAESIAIRICYGNDCQDCSYSYITLNEINFIIISSQQVAPFSTDIYFQEFEIVTNYKREKLQFVGSKSSFGKKINNFKIGSLDSTLQSYNFTLNNFNIVEGDGFFYYDYDDTDPCFAFINLSNMKCLYLKSTYTHCDNTIRLESQCQSIMQSSNYHYYHNKYNQTYILTTFQKSKCQSIDFDDNSNQIICTDKSSPYFECKSGQYNDFIDQQCLPCDAACEKCEFQSTNCSTCKYPEEKLLPSCSCIMKNQFLNEQLRCQNCSKQCSECIESESQCTICAKNRINPPSCICDQDKYTTTDGECIQSECLQKCESCNLSPENCIKCSMNRDNPPLCECIFGFEEDNNGNCQRCKQNQYFDEKQKKCLSCSVGCNKCAGQSCVECQSPLELVNTTCVCANEGQSQIIKYDDQSNISVDCLNNLEIKVSSYQQRSLYDITITFSKEIQPIDFNKNPLTNLLKIYFTVIPIHTYSFYNPRILKNKLVISLKLEVSVSKIEGYLIFLDNQKFISTSQTVEILNVKYVQFPSKFDIGPFFFSNDGVSQNLDDATESLLESQAMNSSTMNFLNSIQFFFYILNTLQPSSYFLQLKAIYPPHLYKFYSIIGKLIYPFVPDYQSSDFKEKFYFYGYKFEQNDISLVHTMPYKKLGYSSSILVNIPLILLKYFIILTVLGLVKLTLFIRIFYPAHPKIIKVLQIIRERLDVENEINLLSVLLAILLQLFETNQSQWISRMGLYSAIVIQVYYGFYFYRNYKAIKTNKFQEINDYYFTSRIDLANSSEYCKYYFLIQYSKKYLVAILLFAFYHFPIVVCSLNTFLFALSCFSTIVLKPYKHCMSRLLKIFGEVLFSILWLLHAILIQEEKTVFKNYIISQDDKQVYNALGSVIMILLFVYNLIYLVEFIYSLIIKLYSIYQEQLDSKRRKKTNSSSTLKKEEESEPIDMESSEPGEYQIEALFEK